ncbi:MAG: histidinol-phosphatase [Clostridia bacterium]|nr:histidinol-phosphatase [Clostridia bacterium]
MRKQNLHTHTTFCDGKNTPEEMVQKALSLGFESIGFSGHSYMFYSHSWSMKIDQTEDYKKEIRALKEKYAGQIGVYCGLEFDMYSKVDLSDYDYVIGAVHYLMVNGEYVGFDRSAESVKGTIDHYFGGNGLKYAQKYYETVAQLPEYGRTDIVGHYDIITKHAEKHHFFDTESKEYQGYAIEGLRALVPKVNVFEINTGAIARGYRTTPYMAPFLLKELKRLGGQIVISSDCHDMEYLDCHFKETVEYAKAYGFNEILIFKDGKFEGQKI